MNPLNPLRPFEETGLSRPGPGLFEDFLRDLWSPMLATPRGGEGLMRFTPRVNVTERADAYEVECELPGLRPEDVNVNLTGDTLTISGEKRREDAREGDTWHVTERSYGAFQRTFTFPMNIDPEGVDAAHENGILKVRVAKSKESQPRRIEIRAGKKEAGAKEIETTAEEVPVSGAKGKAAARGGKGA
jgi:HSP20 family protein